MAENQNPLIKRYLDAGMAFTQMTQSRAEAIVKDLVKTGELQAERAQEFVNTIVERNRRNTEKLVETIRKEVRDQIAALGLATKEDVARLEQRIAAGGAQEAAAPRKAATKATTKASKASKATKATKATKASKASKSTKKA